MKKLSDFTHDEIVKYALTPVFWLSTRFFSYMDKSFTLASNGIQHSDQLESVARVFSEFALLGLGVNIPIITIKERYPPEGIPISAWYKFLDDIYKLGSFDQIEEWINKILLIEQDFQALLHGGEFWWIGIFSSWHKIDFVEKFSPPLSLAERQNITIAMFEIKYNVLNIYSRMISSFLRSNKATWDYFIMDQIRASLSIIVDNFRAISMWKTSLMSLDESKIAIIDKWGNSVINDLYPMLPNEEKISLIKLTRKINHHKNLLFK